MPGGLRLSSTSPPGTPRAFTTRRRGLQRALRERRPDAVQSHSQNHRERAGRGDRLNYPVRINGLALIEDPKAPGASAAGSDFARTTSSTSARPSPSSPTGTRPVRGARSAVSRGGSPNTCTSAKASRRGSSSKTTLDLIARYVVSVRTCGGGGYGPPEERVPERVLRDVLRGQGQRRAGAVDLHRSRSPAADSTWRHGGAAHMKRQVQRFMPFAPQSGSDLDFRHRSQTRVRHGVRLESDPGRAWGRCLERSRRRSTSAARSPTRR